MFAVVKKKQHKMSAKKSMELQRIISNIKPPAHWKEALNAIRHMRKNVLEEAPVDTMGCSSLAQRDDVSPATFRFQTLVSLLLSSQTPDTVTSIGVKRLQHELPGGLTIDSIINTSENDIKEKTQKIGFAATKTKNMKKIAVICRDRYNGDIPDTVDGLMELPGIGYVCLRGDDESVLT